VTGIELVDIEFQRDGKSLFQPLNLSVTPGEYLTLAGPSGGGKTTLLRIIAGLEVPHRGVRTWTSLGEPVSIPGSDSSPTSPGQISMGNPLPLPPGDHPISMVFQGGALYPHLTVRENLEFSQKIRGMPATTRRAKADQVAAKLGLSSWMDRLPEQLSGGESQRVAIGRALMQDPKILLLDEPLANLDGPLRVQLRRLIRQLHQEQRLTTIHVTHDQEEALALGDRVALLHEGRLQQIDRPAVVYHRPINRWVAGFIGSPPMNFMVGEIRNHRQGTAFALESSAPCELPLPDRSIPRLPPGTRWEVGLRPESITVAVESVPDPSKIQPEVELERVEFTGTNLWWQVRCGSASWIIRGCPDVEAQLGSRWRIDIHWGTSVWFHPTTGVAMAGSPPNEGRHPASSSAGYVQISASVG